MDASADAIDGIYCNQQLRRLETIYTNMKVRFHPPIRSQLKEEQ
jgi:hypothetical protein